MKSQQATLVSERTLPFKVALAGFGTVGQSIARMLCSKGWPELRLTHIYNRNVERKKVDWIPSNVKWTDRIGDIFSSDADIFVELIGNLSPAEEWIRRALSSGKSVVTANKQVISHYGRDLSELAVRHHQYLGFEASVAGGIPILRSLRDGLVGDRLVRILGILNGTCNYILTRIENAQIIFSEALKEAQELGIAEADPSADIDGSDAQAKLAILCRVGLRRNIDMKGVQLRSIKPLEPIDFIYARKLQCTIRQISKAEIDKSDGSRVISSVQPMLVPISSPLANISGSQNVVVVEGEYGGETAFSGFGAGGRPTAVSIMSDLVAITRANSLAATKQSNNPIVEADTTCDFLAPHFVRLVVNDRPGIIASLAQVFSQNGINIDSVLQEPGWPKTALPFVVTLEECNTSNMREALRKVEKLEFNAQPPLWLPILDQSKQPQ